ncbi:MAG: hypothetical protein E7485_05025 [Ruminococcaceae bacterium]|nr:hypothetical protein [Oscillospiraceae bacterium]
MGEPNLFSVLFDLGKYVVCMFQNDKKGLERLDNKISGDYHRVQQRYQDYEQRTEESTKENINYGELAEDLKKKKYQKYSGKDFIGRD